MSAPLQLNDFMSLTHWIFLSQLHRQCEAMESSRPTQHVIDPDVLDKLTRSTVDPFRSPYIGNAFLENAQADIEKRSEAIARSLKSVETALPWLREHQKAIQHALDVLRKIEEQPVYSFPPFPPNVWQAIVKSAIMQDHRTWFSLSLVSKQTQTWADQEFFKIITLKTEHQSSFMDLQFSPRIISALETTHTIYCEPNLEYGGFTFDWEPFNIPTLFSHCPNLTCLSLWGNPKDVTVVLSIIDLPPTVRRLSSPAMFSHNLDNDTTPSSFTHPSLSQITHLDLGPWYEFDHGLKGFSDSLLSLTHLYVETKHADPGTVATDVLNNLPQNLRLCILNMGEDEYKIKKHRTLATGELHPTFVLSTSTRPRKVRENDGSEWVLYFEEENYISEFIFGEGVLWLLGEDIQRRRSLKPMS
ncbi:hypothetical protein DL96DRAFT_1585730 [Flagelloscypha sp. PMI_526]|nr:hypothetical protein DL96DRAFT_1585730 [Flagelloscypha sp. PMI_526]